jgi:hypothetical protein
MSVFKAIEILSWEAYFTSAPKIIIVSQIFIHKGLVGRFSGGALSSRAKKGPLLEKGV